VLKKTLKIPTQVYCTRIITVCLVVYCTCTIGVNVESHVMVTSADPAAIYTVLVITVQYVYCTCTIGGNVVSDGMATSADPAAT
jgi:hypothetical protein